MVAVMGQIARQTDIGDIEIGVFGVFGAFDDHGADAVIRRGRDKILDDADDMIVRALVGDGLTNRDL